MTESKLLFEASYQSSIYSVLSSNLELL